MCLLNKIPVFVGIELRIQVIKNHTYNQKLALTLEASGLFGKDKINIRHLKM